MSPVIPRKYGSAENSYERPSTDLSDVTCTENTMPVDSEKESFTESAPSIFIRCGTHLSRLKLEMVTLMFSLPYMMALISSTTMILDKVCLVHFGYPSDICNDLKNHTEIKTLVERLATNYQLGHSLIQTAPAALLVCFIGPWSDHYGRRFPIRLAMFGMVLDSLGSTICAYFMESRVEYYFIPAIFTGIFGGPVVVLTVVYSYASDSTPVEKRTMRYGILEMIVGIGGPLGTVAGGWLYKSLGYPAVFLFSSGGMCLSIIAATFLLKETRGLDNDDPWSVKFKRLLSCKSFKEGFIATAKTRPNQGRKQIILLIATTCFVTISMKSTVDIDYLYVNHQFDWDNTTYSNLTSIYSVCGIAIFVVLIPLFRYFRIGDSTLGLVGTASLLVKFLGIGLARKQAVYHIANILGLLGGCSPFAVRARISKVVTNEDLGKVFSFVATSEGLLPILTSILMTQIFTASLGYFPGMPYITLVIFLILPVGVFSWMRFILKFNYDNYTNINEEPKDIPACT